MTRGWQRDFVAVLGLLTLLAGCSSGDGADTAVPASSSAPAPSEGSTPQPPFRLAFADDSGAVPSEVAAGQRTVHEIDISAGVHLAVTVTPDAPALLNVSVGRVDEMSQRPSAITVAAATSLAAEAQPDAEPVWRLLAADTSDTYSVYVRNDGHQRASYTVEAQVADPVTPESIVGRWDTGAQWFVYRADGGFDEEFLDGTVEPQGRWEIVTPGILRLSRPRSDSVGETVMATVDDSLLVGNALDSPTSLVATERWQRLP